MVESRTGKQRVGNKTCKLRARNRNGKARAGNRHGKQGQGLRPEAHNHGNHWRLGMVALVRGKAHTDLIRGIQNSLL